MTDEIVHINIDWDKVVTVEALKTVLIGMFGSPGMYTTNPKLIKLAKDSNE